MVQGQLLLLGHRGWPLPADAMMTQHPWALPSGLGGFRHGPAACPRAAEACGGRCCAGGQQAASRWPTRTSPVSSKRGTTDGPRDKGDRAADETPLLCAGVRDVRYPVEAVPRVHLLAQSCLGRAASSSLLPAASDRPEAGDFLGEGEAEKGGMELAAT